MILNYSVKNFYSIGEEGASVNFAVNGNAPKTDLYVNAGKDAGRASILEAVIGPNASGKTQLIKGLPFIHHILTTSYFVNPNDEMLFEPHLAFADAPSEVSTRFTVDGRIFEYELIFTKQMILKEEYKEVSRTKERVTGKVFTSREWIPEKNKYKFIDKKLGIESHSELRKNASMLASAMQKGTPAPLARKISEFWTDSVVVHNLWKGGNREDGGSNLFYRMLRDLLEADNEEAREKVSDILRVYDLGFSDFHEEIIKLPNETRSEYYIRHQFNDSNFLIKVEEESSGTKRLISILTSIMRVLFIEKGGIVIIDEIDAYLHPDIVEALVKLFVHPETNPHRAQMLFGTHDHRILTLLDKQQIILTEKNDCGVTESWRLDEVEDVDSRDNYYTQYMAGAYGARPRLGA